LVQVVDVAKPAEYKSKPKRGLIAIAATLAMFLLLSIFVIARHFWRLNAADPTRAVKLAQLRAALR